MLYWRANWNSVFLGTATVSHSDVSLQTISSIEFLDTIWTFKTGIIMCTSLMSVEIPALSKTFITNVTDIHLQKTIRNTGQFSHQFNMVEHLAT